MRAAARAAAGMSSSCVFPCAAMRHPPQRCAAPTCPDSPRGQRLHRFSARNRRKTFLHPAAMNAEAGVDGLRRAAPRPAHQQPGQIRISAGGGVARPPRPRPAVAPHPRCCSAGNRHRQDLLRVRSAPGRPPPAALSAARLTLSAVRTAVLCGRAGGADRAPPSAHPFFTPARAGPQWREDSAAAPHDSHSLRPPLPDRPQPDLGAASGPWQCGTRSCGSGWPATGATITSLRRTLSGSGLAAIGCRRQGA